MINLATVTGLTTLLAQEGEAGHKLPMQPWVYGIGAFGLLILLLIITYTFGKDR